MHTLEITIQRKTEQGWPVVVEQNRSGDFLPIRREDVMNLDEETQTDLISLGELNPLSYGTILGEALFSGKILRAYTDALAQIKETGDQDQLHIFLSIEDPDFYHFRWGRLCAPQEDDAWDFLALNQQSPFSLYLPSSTDRRFPAIGQRDLRALVLVARPDKLADYKMDDFDDTETVLSIQRALGEIPCDILANVEGSVGLPTLDALIERISNEHYTLLHIVAHGQVKRKKTELYLTDDQNQVDRVSSDDLITELRRIRGGKGLPHFAFLCTCESAKPTSEGALGGLAQELVQRLGMPAVLAMTEKVSIPTAEALAEKFYVQLRQHGAVDRALVEACAGLTRRRDINVPALYSRLGGRPLFSDTVNRELTNKEIAFGLETLEGLLPNRAPILEEHFLNHANKVRNYLDTKIVSLQTEARNEWIESLKSINTLCETVLDLNFRALALGQNSPEYNDACPFRGLRAFRAKHREFFFGREQVVENLYQKLITHPFLAVLGASGSGKSSVVLAGLVPFLQKKALEAEQAEPKLIYFTPSSDPVNQLERALNNWDDTPAIVVVDKFEELFTLCTDTAQRKSFIHHLLTYVDPKSPFKIVVTMRADFWGECAPYPSLKDEMQRHQELLAPMTTAELRSAMEQQASQVGLRFEADLSHTILSEVEDEPGAMPLLQHLLLEMWKRRHGRWLVANEYRKLGGIAKAIAYTADEVYQKAPPEEQEHIRNIFIRLTRLGDGGGSGEEYRDTRKRVIINDLPSADSQPDLIRNLIHRLADTRLVVTRVRGEGQITEIEVSHEALIRHWPLLRSWLDEDRTGLQLLANIEYEAKEWEGSGRQDNQLARWNSKLEAIVELVGQSRLSLNELEQEYLDACIRLRDQEVNREKERRKELEKLLVKAERQARLARASQIAAQAQATLDNEDAYQAESLPLLLAREAVLTTLQIDNYVTVEADAALRQAVEAAPALKTILPKNRHSHAVYSAIWSPDETLIATSSEDQTVRIWNAI
ncbi:MAG: CHAT domain-containing protein, partial [Chloroflexota bacterium]